MTNCYHYTRGSKTLSNLVLDLETIIEERGISLEPDLRNNIKRIQTPFPDIFQNTAEDVILSGPAGTGKSFGCMYYLHSIAEKYHNVRILIVRKSRNSLTETGLVTLENVIGFDDPMIMDGPGRGNRMTYNYHTGSVIVIGGLDNPSKVLSSEYDIIFIQQLEECLENDYETLKSRLRNFALPYQRIMGDCNPDLPSHWIKKREANCNSLVLETTHKDNPLLWDDEKQEWTEKGENYINTLKSLTGVRKDRLYYGLWVAAEGAIFEEFEHDKHMCPNFADEIKDRFYSYEKVRVIDFGYVRDHAFCCQWWMKIPKDIHIQAGTRDIYGPIWVMYREFYCTGMTVPVLADYIYKASLNDGNIKMTICDHNPSDVAILNSHKITDTLLARKEQITIHFRRIKDALAKGEILIMEDCRINPVTMQCEPDPELIRDDLPKLPTCTIEEIPILQWHKDKHDRIMKEIPMLGQADHGTKNIGYMLMTVAPQSGDDDAYVLEGW